MGWEAVVAHWLNHIRFIILNWRSICAVYTTDYFLALLRTWRKKERCIRTRIGVQAHPCRGIYGQSCGTYVVRVV